MTKRVVIRTPMPSLEETAKRIYGREWKSQVARIQRIMKKLTPRDKYLQKKYGITEDEYNQQLQRQEGVCLICKRPPGAKPLHVDHDHVVEKWKILSQKQGKRFWKAWPVPPGIPSSRLSFYETAETKPLALAKVRARLKRMSVRGLICWPCNKGLAVFRDQAVRLVRAGGYVAEYNRWLNGSLTEREGFELDGYDDDKDMATESRKTNHRRVISGSVSIPR